MLDLKDVYDLKNNWEKMAESVVKGIISYLGGNYLGEGSYTVQKGCCSESY